MKKKAIWEFLSPKIYHSNILLTMKIATILTFCLSVQVSAIVYSQDAKLKLASKQNTMADLIDIIENQTEYKVFYKTGQFDISLPVSLTSTDQTVGSLLCEVFEGTNYSYKLLDKIIVIAPAETMQKYTVTGTVTDATSGDPLPGVNIVVEGTTNGVTTDLDGKYSINIENTNVTLVFSFVGYITEKIVTQSSLIDVKLIPDVKKLDEVVVIGYGTVKKSDLTGSVSSVGSKALDEVPVANLGQALQGRAPGIEISRNTSRPGETPQIRIRGNRSLTGDNAPLTVVDGIPYNGNINDLNPDDIVSVDILKDASSTAIYGARGSNGVIMVTTKRGRTGKTEVSINSYYGITDKIAKYDVMNGPEYYNLKQYTGYGGGIQPDEQAAMDAGKFTDWQDLIYKKGFSTNTDLTVSGGTENTQFSLGSGFYKETTILPGQSFERYSIRATIDQKISDHIKVGLNTMNTLSYINGESANIMYDILTLSPLASPYNEDGSVKIQPNPREDDQYNPLLLNDKSNWKEQRKRVRTFNSLYAEIEFIKGLKYRLNLGLDLMNENYGFYFGPITPMRDGNVSQTGVRAINSLNYTVENVLTFNRTIANKHNFSFTGLYSFEKSTGYRNAFAAENVSASYVQYYNLTTADNLTAVSYPQNFQQTWNNLLTREETTGYMSYMGRINYNFDSRYLLTLSYRADGASMLAPGKKWHYYPAAAVAWNISNEQFLKNFDVISNLKIRVGYGQTSNAGINPYTTLGSLSLYPYNFGDENVNGYYVNTLANPNLTWEYTTTTNMGLDFSLLNGRITGSIDIYKSKTSDILVFKNLPHTFGVSGYTTNAAKTENKGFETSLSAGIFQSADGFNWSIDANFYINREKIVQLEDPTTTRNITNGWFVGYPINVIYDVEKIGIWQTNEAAEASAFQGTIPGTIKLADINGDGVFRFDDDRKIIGTFEPDWSGGLTNRFSYKNIDLSIVTFAKIGHKVVATYFQDVSYLNRLDGRKSGMHVDYWTENNPTNAFPQPRANDDRPDYATTLGYLDGSFVKVRSINIGYTLPKNLLGKVGITSARIYFTAQNPFILYSPMVRDGLGIDPEPSGQANNATFDRSNNNISNGALILQANTPSTRQFIFGINLKF